MNPSHEYAKYTGYGWECTLPSTEDERKPSVRQPARPDTERKQQKGSKRSIMVSAKSPLLIIRY
jgi:hypothetical protein